MSSADVNHSVESVGYNLSWSSFPQNRDHPLFHFIHERFRLSVQSHFSMGVFFRIYMGNIDPEEFLTRTWAKPRDFVRFFKCARELYSQRSKLTGSEINAIWRTYAQMSWNEIKSSASPFMNSQSIAEMENIFRKIVPNIIDKHTTYSYKTFLEVLKPIYTIARGSIAEFYSLEHFIELIYILGIFGTMRDDASGQAIVQTYHRGNRSFHRDGRVLIHPTVLKAFG
ncbi:P-loop ATPase, Sll1717 family [Mesorhizobium cantuariense]|uniref:P-loop ATPase, Sll1717 family n=1 Tax=Mesorhizobium cantuariense TaxID=1300275 RepID=A0ABV7MTU4_9HYPH